MWAITVTNQHTCTCIYLHVHCVLVRKRAWGRGNIHTVTSLLFWMCMYILCILTGFFLGQEGGRGSYPPGCSLPPFNCLGWECYIGQLCTYCRYFHATRLVNLEFIFSPSKKKHLDIIVSYMYTMYRCILSIITAAPQGPLAAGLFLKVGSWAFP